MHPLRIAIPIDPGADVIDVATSLDPLMRIPDFCADLLSERHEQPVSSIRIVPSGQPAAR